MQITVDGGRPARRPSGAPRASKVAPCDFVDSRSAAGASEGAERPSLAWQSPGSDQGAAGRAISSFWQWQAAGAAGDDAGP